MEVLIELTSLLPLFKHFYALLPYLLVEFWLYPIMTVGVLNMCCFLRCNILVVWCNFNTQTSLYYHAISNMRKFEFLKLYNVYVITITQVC